MPDRRPRLRPRRPSIPAPRTTRGKTIYYGWPPGSEVGPLNWAFLEAPSNAPGEPSFDGLFKWVFGAGLELARVRSRSRHAQGRRRARAGPQRRGDWRLQPVQGARRASFSSSRAGRIRSSRPIRRSPSIRGSATNSAATRRRRSSPGCSWFAGAGHCGLGGGLNSFNSANFGAPNPPSNDADHDLFTALARWVEDGAAPSPGHRDELCRQRRLEGDRHAAPALPASAKGVVQRRRRPEHRRQLYLRRRGQIAAVSAAGGKRGGMG